MTNSVDDANFIAKYIESTNKYLCKVAADCFYGETNWSVIIVKNDYAITSFKIKPLYIPFYYKKVKIVFEKE